MGRSFRSDLDNKKLAPANNILKSAEIHLQELKSEPRSPTFFNENVPNERIVPQQLKNLFLRTNRINMDSLSNLESRANSIHP